MSRKQNTLPVPPNKLPKKKQLEEPRPEYALVFYQSSKTKGVVSSAALAKSARIGNTINVPQPIDWEGEPKISKGTLIAFGHSINFLNDVPVFVDESGNLIPKSSGNGGPEGTAATPATVASKRKRAQLSKEDEERKEKRTKEINEEVLQLPNLNQSTKSVSPETAGKNQNIQQFTHKPAESSHSSQSSTAKTSTVVTAGSAGGVAGAEPPHPIAPPRNLRIGPNPVNNLLQDLSETSEKNQNSQLFFLKPAESSHSSQSSTTKTSKEVSAGGVVGTELPHPIAPPLNLGFAPNPINTGSFSSIKPKTIWGKNSVGNKDQNQQLPSKSAESNHSSTSTTERILFPATMVSDSLQDLQNQIESHASLNVSNLSNKDPTMSVLCNTSENSQSSQILSSGKENRPVVGTALQRFPTSADLKNRVFLPNLDCYKQHPSKMLLVETQAGVYVYKSDWINLPSVVPKMKDTPRKQRKPTEGAVGAVYPSELVRKLLKILIPDDVMINLTGTSMPAAVYLAIKDYTNHRLGTKYHIGDKQFNSYITEYAKALRKKGKQ